MNQDYLGALLPSLIILAILILIAWFLLSIRNKTFGKTGLISMHANLPVGTNERLVLIEVAGQWLLVGVTSSSINTLLTLDSPPNLQDNSLVTTNQVTSWLDKYRFKSND